MADLTRSADLFVTFKSNLNRINDVCQHTSLFQSSVHEYDTQLGLSIYAKASLALGYKSNN